jgi:predicted nucleic acid-binding protein
MRIFLDTNILLDHLLQERASHQASSFIIDSSDQRQLELIVTGLSLINLHYILLRMGQTRKFIEGFVSDVLITCEIASTDSLQLQRALMLGWPDFEDAVQYQAAVSAGRVQAIITNDKKGFKGSRIPVFTPDEFVAEHL